MSSTQRSDVQQSFSRSYRILVEDLLKLCEYIDPRDENKDCYSHRTYELFLRTCTELENLWKTILRDKGHAGNSDKWTVQEYSKIESVYNIIVSDKEVRFVDWRSKTGDGYIKPFDGWTNTNQRPRLAWYQAYNQVKHNREQRFNEASLINVITSLGALHVNLEAYYGQDVLLPRPLPPMFRVSGLTQSLIYFATR